MTNIDGSPLTPEQRARRAGYSNWGFDPNAWLQPGGQAVLSTAEVIERLDQAEREEARQAGKGTE